MTEKDQHLIDELKSNIRRLINSVESSKNEIEAIMNEKRELESNLVANKREFEELKKKYDNLKVAKAMAEGDPENQAARQKITKLIREVDKCIALLNN
jgi:predicted  nucleic acid-binding Zn-ribbon protein